MTHSILSVNPTAATQGALSGFEAVCACGDRYRTSLSENEARRQHADHARFMATQLSKGGRR